MDRWRSMNILCIIYFWFMGRFILIFSWKISLRRHNFTRSIFARYSIVCKFLVFIKQSRPTRALEVITDLTPSPFHRIAIETILRMSKEGKCDTPLPSDGWTASTEIHCISKNWFWSTKVKSMRQAKRIRSLLIQQTKKTNCPPYSTEREPKQH